MSAVVNQASRFPALAERELFFLHERKTFKQLKADVLAWQPSDLALRLSPEAESLCILNYAINISAQVRLDGCSLGFFILNLLFHLPAVAQITIARRLPTPFTRATLHGARRVRLVSLNPANPRWSKSISFDNFIQ